MKLKVIKNGYYITEDLTNLGLVDQGTLDCSVSHLLVVGDIWVTNDEYGFDCIEGNWVGENSEGWWEYEGYEGYFEVVE